MNDNASCKIGMVSLWASILGLVVPILVALLVHIFVKEDPQAYYRLCGLLFGSGQLVALVTGLIGRRSPSGKSGLIISALCIIVVLVNLVLPESREAPIPNLPEMKVESQQSPAGDVLKAAPEE